MAHKKNSLTVSVIVLLVANLLVFHLSGMNRETLSETPPRLPESVREWGLAREIEIPAEFLEILGTSGASLGEYRNEQGESVLLYIIKTSSRRASIHPPEYCFLGGGDRELLRKGLTEGLPRRQAATKVNYLVIQQPEGFTSALYFYTEGSSVTASYLTQQLYFIFKRLKNIPVEGKMIRISSPYPVKNPDIELEKLKTFTQSLFSQNPELQF